MSLSIYDEIVNSSHSIYASLPSHGQPVIRNNGVHEWTILATISLVVPCSPIHDVDIDNDNDKKNENEDKNEIIPISLGTGVKCLPYTKLSQYGDTLHDSHAEIIARRGFIRWLISQATLCVRMSNEPRAEEGEQRDIDNNEQRDREQEEVYVEFDHGSGSFHLKKGVQVYLYISMLPCGDASTVYTASHQSHEEALNWVESDASTSSTTSATSTLNSELEQVMRGRNGYKSISSLRTKPGRPDSIPSISMSCSDKIASWSVLGIQGGLLSNLFREPIYLDGIVIGGIEIPHQHQHQLDWKENVIREEVERALWRRLISIKDHLPTPYRLHRPSIVFSSIPFIHSKPTIQSTLPLDNKYEPSPSPLSISHLPFLPPSGKGVKGEIIFDGSILGHPWKKDSRIKEKGRSRICKISLLVEYERLLESFNKGGNANDIESTGKTSYYDHKHSSRSKSTYQLAKSILRGIPSPGGKLKGLETIDDLYSTVEPINHKSHSGGNDSLHLPSTPPFKGWLVSGKQFESFTSSSDLTKD
ncbi:uncharacterized protein IL334_007020 [Kwoniella shivajii]|uniref:tRNA-specific adenosine deaminase 1 n=1 Tax=Kwoniella shivajii TaxID=564305 RepID=A0ABZ1D7K9_9TREE|nr:hypothetical protein IL334_007020 [Kwoniella shivajii]